MFDRKLKVSIGSSRNAYKWQPKEFTFAELKEKLKNTMRTAETTDEYRKMTKQERDTIKDNGGIVCGHLRDNRRLVKNVEQRSALVFDSDRPDPDYLERYRQNHKYASALYTTHSHRPEVPRYRQIIPLTRDVTPEEYVAIARYVAADIGIDCIDPCSFRVNQLMYWPSTPSDGEYIFEEFDGEWLDPDEFLAAHPDWKDVSKLPVSAEEKASVYKPTKKQADPLAKDGIIGAYNRAMYPIQKVLDTVLSDVYAPSINRDDRYDYIPGESSCGVQIFDDMFVYSWHATDPASRTLRSAFDLVRIHKFGDMDEKESLAAMLEYASQNEEVKQLMLQERQEQAETDFAAADTEDPEWQKRLEYCKKSTVLANTLRNLTIILQNDAKLKGIVFNRQSDSLEIKDSVPWQHPSKYWRDADDAQLVSYVDSKYGSFSARNYQVAVTKVADDRSYHPILEYFASLPAWDGVERLDTLFIDYFGSPDNPYVRAVSRKTFCAAVRRVKVPGCKFDTMPVLNGPQGIGKSTLIAKMGREWFSDSLNLGDTKDKTAAEKLQGYWILEIGELAGLRKAEVETLRSFLSRQNDIYRASFGKRTAPHPRQCIFFGTTNAESGYLRDTTGNRRFWPVKTPGTGTKKAWELTSEEVDQIWAEALVYEAKGEPLYLDPALVQQAESEQREAMESDEREGLVSDYLNTLLPEDWENIDLTERRYFLSGEECLSVKRIGSVERTSVSTIEVWCEAFGKDRSNIRRSDSNEITAMLVRLGWKRQSKKERTKLYGPQYVFVPNNVPN